MAFLKLYRDNLRHNFNYLSRLFSDNGFQWGVVTKLLCGYEPYLQEVIDLGITQLHDSRISNLKKIKNLARSIETVYIKPPAKRSIENIIKYADISMNTEFYTIKLLSDEARRQNKVHKIIIMVETGDLREGVMGEDLIAFYYSVFELPHIEVVGIGTNLNCLYGVMPSQDKLVQLSLYKQIIELKFNKTLPIVSGGTSVTIPLILNKQVPKGVNHFRIGETLFFGTNLFEESLIPGMKGDVFELFTQIIEITEKPMVPNGELAANPQGEVAKIDESLYGKTSYRAILDIGLLDIDPKYLITTSYDFEVVGASSDMIVLNLGENNQGYKVGDTIKFNLKYMGALQILNSEYIEKAIA